ncbi:MAG: hypothetical protein M1358_02105 [Chloroflexi bacterium]|nr:hypothetical protein [Chloroflexota bacterium]
MKKGIVAAILVAILAIVVGLLYWLFTSFSVATIRDLAIIALVVMSGIGVLLGVALTALLLWLVLVLRDRIIPMLEKLTATAETVRGTTAFVSEELVSPLIKVAGAAAGARGMVQALLKKPRK